MTVNYEQFYSLYRSAELQWNSTEALRLAVWLVGQVVPDFYGEEAALEMAPREVIDKTLHKLWGVKLGKPVYPDRYLMPLEIKKAVSDCSVEKIREIREEIKALDPIFDKLEKASAEKKTLPFHSDTFNLTQGEERIMKQEGYLRIENDRYYMPEIIRHALKFKYGTGARPKVLSLLFK